jgi:acylphosphatase
MFVEIISYRKGLEDVARQVLDAWQQEHERYYGQPHGRRVHTTFGRAYPGFAPLPFGGRWTSNTGNYGAVEVYPDGAVRIVFAGTRHGLRRNFMFSRSSYSLPVESGFLAMLKMAWGERSHYDAEGVVYVTQQPDWLPWETLDDHPEAEVGVMSDEEDS